MKVNKFSKNLEERREPIHLDSIISVQFSMILYREAAVFTRKFVIFVCYLALNSDRGLGDRTRFQHILKKHLLGIPDGSDVALIITEFFDGKLTKERLETRIIHLIWRQLTFCQRIHLSYERISSGRPLFPIESLFEHLPKPESMTSVKERCKEDAKSLSAKIHVGEDLELGVELSSNFWYGDFVSSHCCAGQLCFWVYNLLSRLQMWNMRKCELIYL